MFYPILKYERNERGIVKVTQLRLNKIRLESQMK